MLPFDEIEKCMGCGACAEACCVNAIELCANKEGFLYPRINNSKCVNCRKCIDICKKVKLNKHKMMKAFAVKHKNNDIEIKSTSGGAFTALSDQILKDNGSIYGCVFSSELEAIHICAETIEKRDLMRGAKYIQSNLNHCFKEIETKLKQGEIVMFSGVPCQVSGLKTFLGKEYTNLYTVDLLCAGSASPKLFKEYIAYYEKKSGKKILTYYCRSKEKGWVHLEKAVFADGTEDFQSLISQAWGNIYGTHFSAREECMRCPFTSLERTGDISIGDCWGIDKKVPSFADKKGVSILLINTLQGRKLFNECKRDLDVIEIDILDYLQRALVEPTKVNSVERKEFWRKYYKYGIKKIIKDYGGVNLKGVVKRIIKWKI